MDDRNGDVITLDSDDEEDGDKDKQHRLQKQSAPLAKRTSGVRPLPHNNKPPAAASNQTPIRNGSKTDIFNMPNLVVKKVSPTIANVQQPPQKQNNLSIRNVCGEAQNVMVYVPMYFPPPPTPQQPKPKTTNGHAIGPRKTAVKVTRRPVQKAVNRNAMPVISPQQLQSMQHRFASMVTSTPKRRVVRNPKSIANVPLSMSRDRIQMPIVSNVCSLALPPMPVAPPPIRLPTIPNVTIKKVNVGPRGAVVPNRRGEPAMNANQRNKPAITIKKRRRPPKETAATTSAIEEKPVENNVQIIEELPIEYDPEEESKNQSVEKGESVIDIKKLTVKFEPGVKIEKSVQNIASEESNKPPSPEAVEKKVEISPVIDETKEDDAIISEDKKEEPSIQCEAKVEEKVEIEEKTDVEVKKELISMEKTEPEVEKEIKLKQVFTIDITESPLKVPLIDITDSPMKTATIEIENTPEKPTDPQSTAADPEKTPTAPTVSESKPHESAKKRLEYADDSDDINETYQKFINLCAQIDNTEDMQTIIAKKMKKHYKRASPGFVNSEVFCTLVANKIKYLEKYPNEIYLIIKEILDELKLHRVTENTDDISENKDVEMTQQEKSLDRKIRKLESSMDKFMKKIKHLEELEVDDDDDEFESPYIQVHRYKAHVLKIYKKICKLTGERDALSNHRNGLTKISLCGGRLPRLSSVVMATAAKKKNWFPDYLEILNCIKECVKKDNMKMSETELHSEARCAFEELGNLLKRRRQMEEYSDLTSLVTDIAEDPAESDAALAAKLEENRRICAEKEKEIIKLYARKEAELNSKTSNKQPEPEEEQPSESDNIKTEVKEEPSAVDNQEDVISLVSDDDDIISDDDISSDDSDVLLVAVNDMDEESQSDVSGVEYMSDESDVEEISSDTSTKEEDEDESSKKRPRDENEEEEEMPLKKNRTDSDS